MIPEVVAEEVHRILTTKLELSQDAVSSVEAVLERCSIFPKGDEPCPISLRDPDDERVLADAISAGAEILVSGDQNLLVAAEHSPIRILSPRAFLTLTRGPLQDPRAGDESAVARVSLESLRSVWDPCGGESADLWQTDGSGEQVTERSRSVLLCHE